ncbi:MAG: DUF4352 domain-containing protein [Patescibacteria group bacterium]
MIKQIKAGLIFFGVAMWLIGSVAPVGAGATDNSLPVSTSKKSSYVYRFWSDVFHGHFFTSSYNEATKVKNTDSNWIYEGVAFSAFNIEQKDTIPVYRFWSDVFKGHFYTADEAEMIRVRDTDSNWKYESIAYYVYPKDYDRRAETVYRFWSPVFRHHFYTASEEEMTKVRNTDTNWDFEGPAFMVPLEVDNDIKDTTETGEINELVELTDSAVKVSDPVNSSDNNKISPQAENRLISLKVYLENISEEEIDYNEDDLTLVDNVTGIAYKPTTNVIDPSLSGGTLQPGETVEGYVTFEVPKDATDLSLQYASENMVENNNKIQVDFEFNAKVIVLKSEKSYSNFSGEQITGVVQNNTDDPVRYVKITATFFNSAGEKLGENYTYAEDAEKDFLLTGEQANFRIWTIRDPNVKTYTLEVTWATS